MKNHFLPAVTLALPLAIVAPALYAQDKAPAALDLNAPLPTDPALLTGTLPSGVRYIVRQHKNPEGRAAVWMHVNTGSFNETDKQRGIAHYLEHMAFNGSEHFPPGTVIKFFEDLGLTFGRDQNAGTNFDQTHYQLFLADNKPETLKKALTFMSDVAFNLTLDPKEIDAERQIILEEKRRGLGPARRIQDQLFKRIAPGSIVGERVPIGTEETILGVMQQDFKDYWGKWYAPANLTVIVVADMDPKAVADEISAQFGAEPPRPAPAAMDLGVKPYTRDDAAVFTDPEIKNASITLMRLTPPTPPATTVGGFRADLVDTIAAFAFNRRLGNKLTAGNVAWLRASAGASNFFHAARVSNAAVNAAPDKWRDAFSDFAVELQRARLHGFTAQELQDASAQLLKTAEKQAEQEGTTPARILANRYSSHVTDREPIMSARQSLDLLRQLLPTLTPAEISARFATDFEPANFFVYATLPSDADVPSESDLLAFAKKALDVKPPAEADTARISKLLDKDLVPGKAENVTTHKATAVTSAWLPSGVRFHHRFIDTEKDQASVSISLATGTINETAADRGISDAAALAWQGAATSKFTSTQIRDFLIGKNVSVRGSAGEDTMALTVSGSPSDLEPGMQVAYLLLTDPLIEKPEFARFKTSTLQALAARPTSPDAVAADMIDELIYPAGETRTRILTAAQVNALTLEAAQAWLHKAVSESPIEVAVVGDIPLDKALALAEKYLGSLPTRDRISSSTLADKRAIARKPGPLAAERTIETRTDKAQVADGFFGPEPANVRDVQLMGIASQILATRMTKVIREEKNLVYSISPAYHPDAAYPGFSLYVAASPTTPSKAAALGPAVSEVFDDFARTGPTDDEMKTARNQTLVTVQDQVKHAAFWMGQTAHLDYRNRNLDDTAAIQDNYAKYTAADVKAAFNKYYTPNNKIRVTVTPKAPETK